MTFQISDFDKLMYKELEEWNGKPTHRHKGCAVSIHCLAEKHKIDVERILESYRKLELLGLCRVRTKNKVVLETNEGSLL